MATRASFHRAILLAKVLTKPWIAPIGQNRREWRALPRGRFSAVFARFGWISEPRGKARHFRRLWPNGTIHGFVTASASMY